MADNTTLNTGTGGDVIATDDIGGVKYQRIKLVIGADNTNDGDVASGNPLPVTGSISAVGVSNVVSVAAVGVSSIPITDVRVSSGALRVSSIVAIGVSSMPTTAVTQSGGWSIGVSSAPTTTVSSANLGVNITQITGIAPALGNGAASTTTLRVTVADDSTGIIASNVSSGNIRVSSIVAIGVSSMPTTAVTQSGGWSIGVSSTASIGVSSVATHGVTQSGAWAIAVSSVTNVTSVATSTQADAASTFATFTAAGGLRNYIMAYSCHNTASTAVYVDIRDGAAGAVLWSIPLPAGGGANLANAMPIFKTAVSTALAYDVSAAVSTVYLNISGFQAA